MYCRNCGESLKQGESLCHVCNDPTLQGDKYCFVCGEHIMPQAAVCPHCGVVFDFKCKTSGATKSRLAAGLLGIFLGGLGIHSFYLGYNKKGFIQIAVTLLTFGAGSLWGLIEGILIFAKVINNDAKGKPLIEL